MALLKQCFCYSLRQGSFIIGSYSLVVYCVAFAVELWWIVESLLILPAPAYTLCALYFFDFIMAAILLFGLLVRQRKYLMSWTLMTVLSFFPEAGMVLFMSLYYWPAHKFEYGVIELVYWSLRAIFNIFGAVCVCSLYLTWRDEELILGRLHDLTLANVETGSTGVGVLRSGNFTGTLKGNNNLAYQNYAYVDSSAGLPDNLNYKNSNAFHSKRGYGYYSPSTLHSFYTTVEHTPTTQPSSSSSQTQKTKKHFYYCCKHHSFFQRCCVVGGDGVPCQQHSPKLFPLFPLNCFYEKNCDKKTISSLPILWTESPSKIACCCDLANHQYFNEQPVSVKCGCSNIKFNKGLCSSSGDGGGIGRNTYLFCSINQAANPHSTRNYYETLSKLPSAFHDEYDNDDDDQQGPSTLSRSEKNVNLDKTVLTATVASKLQTSEPHNINKTGAKANGLRPKFLKRRQSCHSSSSESGTAVGGGVPKIEIVICTEVHGSVETKIIRRPDTSQQQQQRQNKAYHKHLQQGKVVDIPFSHFRRALSDYPRSTVKMMEPENDDDSSVHSGPFGSMDSTSSIIVASEALKKSDRKGGAGNKSKSGHKGKHGYGKGKGEGGRRGFKLFNYISHITTCCVSRSASSLLSGSCSGDLNDDEIDDISVGGGSFSYNRGLSNTRSFTMHSSDHHLGGNRGASLAMKSEFNPAMLFDPAYRKSRISELGIAGIGLEPPGQLPMGTFNRMNRSRSLWNVSNEDYWNRPPPSRPVSLGYVNHIHQLEQMAGHKDCCVSMNNNSNATMNLNKQMMMKGGFGGMGVFCSQQSGYRNPIHGSVTSVSTSNPHHSMGGMGGNPTSLGGHLESCGVHRESDHRRNWLATGRRAQSVDGLNHFYHRYYGKNIAAHHNLHPSGLIHGDHHSQDWSKSSLCPDEPSDDCRNYHDIAL